MPTLHEFVPHAADTELAASVGLSVEECQATISRLAESNPMLGLRGCRLGITSPEIIAMQARAVLEAALDAKAKGVNPVPKLMVPLIGTVAEYTHQADIIKRTAKAGASALQYYCLPPPIARHHPLSVTFRC